MSASKIGKAIRENCKEDTIMQGMLLELLDFNLTGRQWYEEKYMGIIEKYARKEAEKDEN